MRCAAVLLFVAFCAASCVAQYSDDYRACNDKANPQAEMNEVYRTLVAKSAGQPEALAKIKAAEGAWLAYRDA